MTTQTTPRPSPKPPSSRHAGPIAQLRRAWRNTNRFLAKIPPARASLAVPRTARFVAQTIMRGRRKPLPGVPVPPLSPALIGGVAMDEMILTLAMGPNRFPRRHDYERVSTEVRGAHKLYDARGWLDDPRGYHGDPPLLRDPVITKRKTLGFDYEELGWHSGYEPHAGEPGAERWRGYEANRTARAWMLRHDDHPRPWLVCVHGFGMGIPFTDARGFHYNRLHKELGLNLLFPVLPLHGARKISRFSGEEFLSFDMMNGVHGLAQSAWDVRRLLSWLRLQDPQAIGMYGVSLGGYVTALTAAFENDLDLVVAGIPVCDFPDLFGWHSPTHIRLRSIEHHILGGAAEDVHSVVSPLSFAPLVRPDARFIFAGLGDRMVHPGQPHRLWEHWDRPKIAWYAGNHVGYIWSREVAGFVNDALVASGFGPNPPRLEKAA